MMFISRFGHCSLGRSGENNPLERRGVKILTKCSRRQIEIVSTQTILKMDKRMVSTSFYNKELVRSIKVIPAPTIQTGLKINLSAPRASNITWQVRGPQE
jgi:hypothetical protein